METACNAKQNQAAKDVGFFVLTNHGISQELVKEVFAQTKAFFALTIEEKRRNQADKNNRGYRGMYEEAVDRDNQYKGDTKVTGEQQQDRRGGIRVKNRVCVIVATVRQS